MHVAHSKLSKAPAKPRKPKPAQSDFAKVYNYKLYKKACKELAERIAAIRLRRPDWYPKFNTH